MKISTRSFVIVLGVCCLTVGAGVSAKRALANGSTYYCYQCTLPSNGVPAQSNVFKNFYYNEFESLGNYVAAHILQLLQRYAHVPVPFGLHNSNLHRVS